MFDRGLKTLLVLALKNCESRKKQTTALSMIICLGFPLSVFFLSFIETDELTQPERQKNHVSFLWIWCNCVKLAEPVL